jgi:hypothetical protein
MLRAHDRHRPWVIAPVAAVLLVYCWCYTQLAAWTGVPTPAAVVQGLGLALPEVLDDDGNVEAKLHVGHAGVFASDDERLIVFAGLFACFVCTYFAPLRLKSAVIVAWFLALMGLLYGAVPTLTLVAGHLAIYVAFHPLHRGSGAVAAVFAGNVAGLMGGGGAGTSVGVIAAAGLGGYGYSRIVAPWLLRGGRGVGALRVVLIQATMIAIAVATIREGITGAAWKLPVGLVLFCYQWARMMVYAADYRDGEVPRELSPSEYLAVFMSPASLFNVGYAPYFGQGYAYLKERHLAEDKSALAWSGVKFWCVALVYLVFAEQVTAWFIAFMREAFGIKVYAFTSHLVRAHLRGAELSTPTVLVSTLLDQARIFLIYGGVTHFRVGSWRVLGYRVDPQYDRPWLATNFVSLWGRFAFHFREFLVRVFYYPVFLRWFRRRGALRIFVATMVATVIGNLVWGHVPPKTITDLRWEALATILSTWPYFVLLGLGISLTQVWLLRRPRTRKPWTLDRRLVLDLLCAYLTLQAFALIHIFIRPQPGGSLAEYVRLFLIGLGIRL